MAAVTGMKPLITLVVVLDFWVLTNAYVIEYSGFVVMQPRNSYATRALVVAYMFAAHIQTRVLICCSQHVAGCSHHGMAAAACYYVLGKPVGILHCKVLGADLVIGVTVMQQCSNMWKACSSVPIPCSAILFLFFCCRIVTFYCHLVALPCLTHLVVI